MSGRPPSSPAAPPLSPVFFRLARLQLTCRDGDPNLVISRRGLGGEAFCNHDQPGDGACTFAACGPCGFANCPGPSSGVCPAGEPLPQGAKVVVPEKKRVRRSGVTFRCLPEAPCDAAHRCSQTTLTCRDGVAADRTCDYDQHADGVCTFAFYCLEVCGPTPRETVAVPVGETRVIERPRLPTIGFTQFTLQCLPPS